ALRRISLVCRSSRFSRSKAFRAAPASEANRPARHCRDRSSSPTHPKSVQRTARARTSGENLFVVLLVIAPSSQELELPSNRGGVQPEAACRRTGFHPIRPESQLKAHG